MLDTFREEFKPFPPALSKLGTETDQGIECFRGFNFQFLIFQLFLETDLSLNTGVACQFSFLLPCSSKGQTRDKALCCIYLFLLGFRR